VFWKVRVYDLGMKFFMNFIMFLMISGKTVRVLILEIGERKLRSVFGDVARNGSIPLCSGLRWPFIGCQVASGPIRK
jgi:hypothetical protein